MKLHADELTSLGGAELAAEADLHGHEEMTEGVALNNIYEVALENEIYLEQGPSINKFG